MTSDLSMFRIEVAADTEPAVMSVFGELDAETASALAAAGEQVVSQGHRHVQLDCSEVTFCDSFGLRVMAELGRRLEPDGSFVVVNASARVLRVLQVTGLAERFGIREGDESS
ncbi:MAG: STAS domain-containing protein [Actinomycetota bacterium]|nr:STAS domain-containing protein [Actinomycetota bacterium]